MWKYQIAINYNANSIHCLITKKKKPEITFNFIQKDICIGVEMNRQVKTLLAATIAKVKWKAESGTC